MYPDLLTKVKTILDLEFEIKHDDALNIFIEQLAQMVNLYVGTEVLPVELHFVVVEGAVARYRKMGAEGFESEGIDVISIKYEELLAPYFPYLDSFRATNKKVKFL